MNCDKCGIEIKGRCYKFVAEKNTARKRNLFEKTRFRARAWEDYFKPEEKDRLLCKDCAVKEIFKAK